LDKIIIYGIVVGITLGVTIGVIIPLVPSDSSEPKRTPEEAEKIIQEMLAGYDQCTQQYGVVGDQVNECYRQVRAYYGVD